MNFDLEQALDEFDSRYLESYHQVTAKMASSGLRPTPESPLRLSSPLLPSREDHFQVLRDSRPQEPANAPSGPGAPMASVTAPAEFNLNDYLNPDLSDFRLDGPSPQNRSAQGSPDHLQFPHRPELAHRASAPEPQWLAVDVARRSLVSDTGTPRALQRSFSASSIVKTQRRPQRRATNVGNPFYKSKPSPRRRRGLFDDALDCKMEC